MEPQYQQQQQQQEDGSCGGGGSGGSGLANGGKAAGGGGGGAGFLCRQSSTRWIPTSDQIRILRDLYYNNGLRSPNAEQIQRISARLRQYGKIEGKNVFYWFQNHKARERQKKRLTVDVTAAPTTANNSSGSCCKSTSAVMSPGFPTGSRSSTLYNVGNDGSLLAETSFREYCMAGGSMSGVGWGGADSTTSAPWMHHCPSAANAMSREIETLQLFPISAVKEEHDAVAAAAEYYSPSRHFVAKDGRSSSKNHYTIPSFYCEEQQQQHHHHHQQLYSLNGGGNAAETRDLASESLELTLNSYYYSPPDST